MTQVTPNWLGSFDGSELSFQDCEVLSIQHIPRVVLKEEAALMDTKWFDYRRVHPMHATYYFMECYKVAYQDFIRRAVDKDRAQYASPTALKKYKMTVCKKTGKPKKSKAVIRENLTFLDSRESLSFWKLRQLADKLGVRYDFFMNRMIDWYVTECFRRSSLHPPRPGHLSANDEALASMLMAWEEELNIRLQVPTDEHYKIANFAGSTYQLAYEKFIVSQVNMRQHKRFSLSASIYTHSVLRVEEAIRQFGCDLVSDAIGEIIYPNEISHN